MDNKLEERLLLIRNTISILKYGRQEQGGITVHPSDRDNFNKGMSTIDDAAREIAIIFSEEEIFLQKLKLLAEAKKLKEI
jgi:hypothetical protein